MLLLFLSINMKNVSIAYWIINLYIYPLIRTAFYGLDAYILFMIVINFISIKKYYVRHNGINIIDYAYLFLRRFIRLAPAYYIIFFSFWALIPFLSEAPMWYNVQDAFTSCPKYWFWQVLFLGNFVPFYELPYNKGCFYWGFWVAIDI